MCAPVLFETVKTESMTSSQTLKTNGADFVTMTTEEKYQHIAKEKIKRKSCHRERD